MSTGCLKITKNIFCVNVSQKLIFQRDYISTTYWLLPSHGLKNEQNMTDFQLVYHCSIYCLLLSFSYFGNSSFPHSSKTDIKVEISDNLLFLDSEMSGDYPDIPPPSYEDVIKGNYFGSSTEARRNDGEIVPSADGSYARVPMFSRQITDSRTLEMRGSLPVQQFLLSRGTDIPQNQICEAIQQSDDQGGPSYGALNSYCESRSD